MSLLFSPLKIRDLTFKNRIFMSPMCQYSCTDGILNEWHDVHLGSRAVGGVALVIVEATGVSPAARISPGDAGLWNETQMAAFTRVNHFIRARGAIAGVQLAHAGRKASTMRPWEGDGEVKTEAWTALAPSAVAFKDSYPKPRAMTLSDIDEVIGQFRASALLALKAGVQVVELHMAHGYLLHEFLSPLSNHRTDEFGGAFENRVRLPLAVAKAVREVWPAQLPLFVRISATDWVAGGWDLEQSVRFAVLLKSLGVDLIDCSSGGLVPDAKIPVGPGYQVPFAEGVKKGAEILTGAVGLITDGAQAEAILAKGQADVVLLARALLRDPYWPRSAASQLGERLEGWPVQYGRA